MSTPDGLKRVKSKARHAFVHAIAGLRNITTDKGAPIDFPVDTEIAILSVIDNHLDTLDAVYFTPEPEPTVETITPDDVGTVDVGEFVGDAK